MGKWILNLEVGSVKMIEHRYTDKHSSESETWEDVVEEVWKKRKAALVCM